ncbi:hypothetical protein niasHT_032570 [Heterodera trifolii]|uniref:Nuclear receptor domain-containing protein n=1 Tax=Heterodera trifolii TaxID=157864 RepID=A0ABD2J7I8_9BILA
MNFSESNEMDKGAIKQEKRKYKKNPKTARECKVCGRVTLFKYYKIQSCEACKQFFRRTIISRRSFICPKSNSCAINKEMKSCRACRLDKCLLEGMDPTMVEAEQSTELSQFIQSLYKRREFLQQQLQEKKETICNMDTEIKIENDENCTANERNEDNQILCHPSGPIYEKWSEKSMLLNLTISSLKTVEQQIRSFIDIRREFDDNFFEQFSTLNEFLNGAKNIVFNPNKYMKIMTQHINPDQIYKWVSKHGNFGGKNPLLVSEIVSVIDLFRTMPHFTMLEPKDQAILLSFVAIPLIYLNARFYSSKINSPIVRIIPNSSFSPLYLYYKNPFYAGDKT